jgi:AcrR family transcriptional regulator
MTEIGELVGMKSASLYNHISSKQEILSLILMQVAQSFVEEMAWIKQSALSPLQKVQRLIGLHVRLTVDNPDYMAILVGDWAHLEDEHRSEFIRLRDSYEEDFKSILQACLDDGSFRPVNVEVALYTILSSLRWTYSWYAKHEDISPIDLESELYKCLIEGLTEDRK